jgi:hypothetical protein
MRIEFPVADTNHTVRSLREHVNMRIDLERGARDPDIEQHLRRDDHHIDDSGARLRATNVQVPQSQYSIRNPDIKSKLPDNRTVATRVTR